MHQVAALLHVHRRAYRRRRVQVGLAEAEHARKIKPWTVRLKSATKALAESRAKGDRKGMLRQVEGVWFWVGRLTAELLAVEDPQYNEVRLAGAQAIIDAEKEMTQVRKVLGPLPGVDT